MFGWDGAISIPVQAGEGWCFAVDSALIWPLQTSLLVDSFQQFAACGQESTYAGRDGEGGKEGEGRREGRMEGEGGSRKDRGSREGGSAGVGEAVDGE